MSWQEGTRRQDYFINETVSALCACRKYLLNVCIMPSFWYYGKQPPLNGTQGRGTTWKLKASHCPPRAVTDSGQGCSEKPWACSDSKFAVCHHHLGVPTNWYFGPSQDQLNQRCQDRHACVLSRLSCVRLFAVLWAVAYWAPQSMGFSRQEYWSGLPFPTLGDLQIQGLNLSFFQLVHCLAGSLPPEPCGKTQERLIMC